MNCLKPLIGINSKIYLIGNNSKLVNYFSRNSPKSELKIKWVNPGKAACISPEKSGDLDPMVAIDLKQTQFEFKHCKELEDANDLVKRLFSLEFAPRRKTTQIYVKNIADTVRRHPLDLGSVEATVGRWTGIIRSFQNVMDGNPRDVHVKVILKQLIDKRKQMLKRLRKWDYKRFEWLIDNLNIVYKPEPLTDKIVTRKRSLTKLTDKYCEDVKNEKLTTYRLQLEAQQPAFLESKISTLEFIRKEQEDCGAVVTVSQVEIDRVKKQLEELLANCKENKTVEN